MIYDTLNNLPNYLGVSDNLDTVIEYIMARDITTLPALARVLHTDLNTLLSFREDLTAEEIARFTDDLDRLVREEGYEAAFQRGMDEIHQYPNCEALIYPVIFYLDGARFLYGVSDKLYLR